MSRFAYLLLICLVLAGCRTQPHVNAHIESVNAEYRELEDYVYCLEDENSRLQKEIEAVRRGAVAPGAAGSSSSGGGSTSGGIFRRRPAGGAEELSPPRIESNPSIDVPSIDIPSGGTPMPPPASRSELQRPSAEPVLATLPAEAAAIPAQPTDTKVTHLFLNPLLTGGADFDGQPGDEGLSVVLEPRNSQDEYVSQAGAISVVVLDPTRQGDAARVARWDFDQSAVRQMLAASSPARGLKLELPWPAAPPANSHLKVFIRYETADGRRLQSDREIHLASAGEISPGWTPRPGAPLAAATHVASLPAPPSEPAPSLPLSEEPTPAAPPVVASPLSPPAALSAAAPSASPRPRWSANR